MEIPESDTEHLEPKNDGELAGKPVEFALSQHTIIENQNETTEELAMLSPKLIEAPIEASAQLLETIETIPSQMAFKIGEAADMVGVKQYVLRYWESEFETLRPKKSKNNQRIYSRRDVETAMMIKKLLYEDRFSIEGARSALKQLKSHVKEERNIKAIADSQETAVQRLKNLLVDIQRVRDLFT